MDKEVTLREIARGVELVASTDLVLTPANATLRGAAASIRTWDARLHDPRPLDEYHEDMGCVLLWHIPICEPPHCGTPDDSGAQKYPDGWLTHFTRLPDFSEIMRNWTARQEGEAK